MKVQSLRMCVIDVDTFIETSKRGLLKQKFSSLYRNAFTQEEPGDL